MNLVDVLKDFGQYGIFAALFIWLLYYVLKKNDENIKLITDGSKAREDKLYTALTQNQDVLTDLAKNFEILKGVECDVKEIKDRVRTYQRSDDK